MMHIGRFRHLVLVAALAVLSCDEPFPGYEEPADTLRGTISVIAPDTVVVYQLEGGAWAVNTPLILEVSVINAHDDLLQGEALIQGIATIQSFADIPRVVTIPLTMGTLLRPPVFQGDVAIAPADSAVFSTLWLPIDPQGVIVFDGLPFTTANERKYYGPIDFDASAEVQMFEKVQPIRFGGYFFSLLFEVRQP
jgi:hypothetical protein